MKREINFDSREANFEINLMVIFSTTYKNILVFIAQLCITQFYIICIVVFRHFFMHLYMYIDIYRDHTEGSHGISWIWIQVEGGQIGTIKKRTRTEE